jgi:hypothetical protein
VNANFILPTIIPLLGCITKKRKRELRKYLLYNDNSCIFTTEKKKLSMDTEDTGTIKINKKRKNEKRLHGKNVLRVIIGHPNLFWN